MNKLGSGDVGRVLLLLAVYSWLLLVHLMLLEVHVMLIEVAKGVYGGSLSIYSETRDGNKLNPSWLSAGDFI